MRQLLTKGIVLSRTDYGEADRIVTLITPDYGKLRLMARGVRKIKSRAAGGIELFSVSEIGFVHGRGELGTLISARLLKHYATIVRDINRVQTGYGLIKMLHQVTEDRPEREYFELIHQTFMALDESTISLDLINLWFQAQLLRLAGYTPNLQTDVDRHKLEKTQIYTFDFDNVAFKTQTNGNFTADHIKTLRLLFSSSQPKSLAQILGVADLLSDVTPLITGMRVYYIK